MTIQLLIRFMVSSGVLTEEEANTALKTGRLPDDIIERLTMADKVQQN